jgi:hypothetical protein
MERIKIIHDTVGHTLTAWLGDPRSEYVSTLTDDEVVVMKDKPDASWAPNCCTTVRAKRAMA